MSLTAVPNTDLSKAVLFVVLNVSCFGVVFCVVLTFFVSGDTCI